MARTFTFLFLVSISAAIAILVFDGTLVPFGTAPAAELGSVLAFDMDARSLVLGGAVGVIIGQVLSVPWTQIPQRIANWFGRHQGLFGQIILAGIFIAILIYY
ncbi:MAG: hypothetical protein AAFV45_05525 [Pseudomonadota bacterium]